MDSHESSREVGDRGPLDPPAEASPQGSEREPQPAEPAPPPAAPEPASKEIMTKLPHSRPRRTTPRRKPRPAARPRAAARKPPGVRTPTRRSASSTGSVAQAAGSTPRPFPASEPAPGLPRLALEGALEAAKLPLKVGAGITFKVLDAVARGLRGD